MITLPQAVVTIMVMDLVFSIDSDYYGMSAWPTTSSP